MNDGGYDPNADERNSRLSRRKGPAIDLTGLQVRLALTALVIGLGALIIYFVIQLSQGEAPAEVIIPTPEPTADLAQPLATFTPGATSTPPPQDIPPTVPAEVTVPAGVLGAGGNATISGTGGAGANFRTSPEIGNNLNIIRTLFDDTPVSVLEGPTEGEGFVWWKVRTAEGEEGWVVQDFLTPS
jgi:hypothetical protein